MKEATYDEATDTWKLPWWANAKDDGNVPLRQHGPWSMAVTLNEWMFGVGTESWMNNPWGNCDYHHRHTTIRFGPLWFVYESFKAVT